MYICICKGLSQKDIQDKIDNGDRSVRELGKSCGAGTDCGTCRFKLNQMIKEESQDSEMDRTQASKSL